MSSERKAPLHLRSGVEADVEAIRELYVAVARESGGLARFADEVTAAYVNTFVSRSMTDGIIIVAESSNGEIVGELHAYRNSLRRFSHVLGALTVAVLPKAQGRGVGRHLFEALLAEVREHRADILRVELIVQESNVRAQRLYASLGFHAEGRLIDAIQNMQTGIAESDIPMAWLRNRAVASRLDARFTPNQLI